VYGCRPPAGLVDHVSDGAAVIEPEPLSRLDARNEAATGLDVGEVEQRPCDGRTGDPVAFGAILWSQSGRAMKRDASHPAS
jgi:hypothetical protein